MCKRWKQQDYQKAIAEIEEFNKIKEKLEFNMFKNQEFNGPLSYISND